jgi:hypothetical protein
MRFILSILFILIINAQARSGSSPVNKEFPFKILFAENAKSKTGKALKSLQMISIQDTITIGESGNLVVIHYTGLPVEFDRDTVIAMHQLDLAIIEGVKDKTYDSENLVPDLKYLFIKSKSSAKKARVASSCTECKMDLSITYPPIFSKLEFYYDGSICLKWRATNTKKYEVDIRNVLSDQIKRYETTANEITIAPEEIAKWKADQKIFLVFIHDLDNNKVSHGIRVREFPVPGFAPHYGCTVQKASSALLIGLYLELNVGDTAEAEKFYKLATTLSGKAFYATMLQNFMARKE